MPTQSTQENAQANPIADKLVRVTQIVGSKKAGIAPLIPISRSAWFAGVKTGRYPPPDVRLGARTVCWRLSTIAAFLEAEEEKTRAQQGGAL